jgi:cbb3-type cytochrome oxidase maturation protein
MDLVFLLLPASLVLATVAVIGFIWCARSGQFDDLETPAHRVLFDDEDREAQEQTRESLNAR